MPENVAGNAGFKEIEKYVRGEEIARGYIKHIASDEEIPVVLVKEGGLSGKTYYREYRYENNTVISKTILYS